MAMLNIQMVIFNSHVSYFQRVRLEKTYENWYVVNLGCQKQLPWLGMVEIHTHKNGENLGCFMLGLPSTFCHGEWNGYEWIQWVNRYLWGHILKNGHACLANHVCIYIYVYEMGETWRSERANGLLSLRYFEILQCIYIYINMSCRKYIEYVERITET